MSIIAILLFLIIVLILEDTSNKLKDVSWKYFQQTYDVLRGISNHLYSNCNRKL